MINKIDMTQYKIVLLEHNMWNLIIKLIKNPVAYHANRNISNINWFSVRTGFLGTINRGLR